LLILLRSAIKCYRTKGAAKLPPGIYAVFFPGKQLRTEFLISKEQVINITADTSDLVNKTIVTSSKENVLYEKYQKFVAPKGNAMQQERRAYSASIRQIPCFMKNYAAYNKQLNDYREDVIKNYPSSMMAALLNAMKEPVYPATVPSPGRIRSIITMSINITGME
jgi:hypothetical protein